MLNRVLCIMIIAVVMSVGTAYASFTDLSEDERLIVDTIIALGLLKPARDDSFGANDTVTRADVAKVLRYICEGETESQGGNWHETFYGDEANELALKTAVIATATRFEDVPTMHDAYADIEYVSSHGLMNGVSRTMFEPDWQVTLQEMLKTLLHLMGYDVKASTRGGYPIGYNVTANDLGLIRGISVQHESPLNKGDFARILYNAIDILLLQPIVFGLRRATQLLQMRRC